MSPDAARRARHQRHTAAAALARIQRGGMGYQRGWLGMRLDMDRLPEDVRARFREALRVAVEARGGRLVWVQAPVTGAATVLEGQRYSLEGYAELEARVASADGVHTSATAEQLERFGEALEVG